MLLKTNQSYGCYGDNLGLKYAYVITCSTLKLVMSN